ncbi:hypothetical protein [Arthrobacter globiformis]|uniref:hypothetical protein n=1 Tax=Arthrobacter globiformis TaxID=1665 RepID=UPI00277DA6DD|nr:hypothetical protein [Arthrobacter globiformis]MDQ0865801.1 hypothetical protein [Arthrobacter globiformis]
MDEIYQHRGVTVRYKLRQAKQDRQHLIVVFAGVQQGEHDFYGFDGNALDNVKGAVLWIKDSFDGQNSYYLCAAMDFKIEGAVSALIDSTLDRLGLSAADCTLLGGSKGGSAALHLGLSHDYRNIVASVPQSRVGTYTRQKLKDTFAYMADDDPEASESALNEYIPRLAAVPKSLDKNIYIVSSEADPEYKVHIEPLLDSFSRYENFNLLLTDSTLVRAHPEVTPYNVPFILSTLYALCEGLAPRFGMVRNGNGERDRATAASYFARKRDKPEPVAGFHWIQIKGDTMSFRAYAAALGEPFAEEPAERPRLIFKSRTGSQEFEVDAMADRTLNSKLYGRFFCDYLWAGLKNASDRQLNLRTLPVGRYELAASFVSASGRHTAPLPARDAQKATGIFRGHAYHLDASRTRTQITKLSLDGTAPDDALFSLTDLSTDGTVLFVRGVFAVPREEMRSWNDGVFALTLTNDSEDVSFQLGSSRPRRADSLPAPFDPESYAWSSFSTPGHAGINLRVVADGDYDCFVSFVREGRVYTGRDRFTLTIDQGSLSIGALAGVK